MLNLLAESMFQNWSLEAIGALLLTIGGLIGGGVTWLTGRGTDWYIKISEWRLKRRERISKLNPPLVKSLDWKDQVLEDKGLAVGYRAMMLSLNSRIQSQDDLIASIRKEMSELRAAYSECLQSHAEERSRAERFEIDLRNLRESYSRLEQINEKYRMKLHRNGIDDPSPIHFDEKGKKPDKPFQS